MTWDALVYASHVTRRIGRWELRRRLGRGGNGEVWEASDGAAPIALKLLNEGSDYKLARFRAEVDALKQCADIPGVLPYIGSNLTQPVKGERAWLAMPIATPLRDHLAVADVRAVMEAMRDVAGTLTQLHARGVYHRDIKPENLFWYGNRAHIGDFGLVAFPGKEALTVPGHKLGPMFYIADEMLSAPETANFAAADVFSFAKTLWVLLSGQSFPPQGEIRSATERDRLADWVDFDRSEFLDYLIERCTRRGVSERPSMDDVRKELESFLAIPSSAGSAVDVTAMLRPVQALVAPHVAENERERASKVSILVFITIHDT